MNNYRKVKEIIFKDKSLLPTFILEDGTVMEPNEWPTGSCWALSWQEKKEDKS